MFRRDCVPPDERLFEDLLVERPDPFDERELPELRPELRPELGPELDDDPLEPPRDWLPPLEARPELELREPLPLPEDLPELRDEPPEPPALPPELPPRAELLRFELSEDEDLPDEPLDDAVDDPPREVLDSAIRASPCRASVLTDTQMDTHQCGSRRAQAEPESFP